MTYNKTERDDKGEKPKVIKIRKWNFLVSVNRPQKFSIPIISVYLEICQIRSLA